MQSDLPRAYREIKVLKQLHHQHISQLYQVIETEQIIYLVIEVGLYSVFAMSLVSFIFSFVLVGSCLITLSLKKD